MEELPRADLYLLEKAEKIVKDLKKRGFPETQIVFQNNRTPEAVLITLPWYLDHIHEDHLRFFINYLARRLKSSNMLKEIEVWHEEKDSEMIDYYICEVIYHPDRSVRDVLMKIYTIEKPFTEEGETIVTIPLRQADHPLVSNILDFLQNYPKNKKRYSWEYEKALKEIYAQV